MRQEYELLYVIYILFITSALLANLAALIITSFLKRKIQVLEKEKGITKDLLISEEDTLKSEEDFT